MISCVMFGCLILTSLSYFVIDSSNFAYLLISRCAVKSLGTSLVCDFKVDDEGIGFLHCRH